MQMSKKIQLNQDISNCIISSKKRRRWRSKISSQFHPIASQCRWKCLRSHSMPSQSLARGRRKTEMPCQNQNKIRDPPNGSRWTFKGDTYYRVYMGCAEWPITFAWNNAGTWCASPLLSHSTYFCVCNSKQKKNVYRRLYMLIPKMSIMSVSWIFWTVMVALQLWICYWCTLLAPNFRFIVNC